MKQFVLWITAALICMFFLISEPSFAMTGSTVYSGSGEKTELVVRKIVAGQAQSGAASSDDTIDTNGINSLTVTEDLSYTEETALKDESLDIQNTSLAAAVNTGDIADMTVSDGQGDLIQENLRPGETPIGDLVTEETLLYKRGESLGTFTIVGYYGNGKTYSGTIPKSHHTVSSDLSLFPVGTKLFINNTVYTVEDKGSSVKGNIIDIYFDTREEAVNVTKYGKRSIELYSAVLK